MDNGDGRGCAHHFLITIIMIIKRVRVIVLNGGQSMNRHAHARIGGCLNSRLSEHHPIHLDGAQKLVPHAPIFFLWNPTFFSSLNFFFKAKIGFGIGERTEKAKADPVVSNDALRRYRTLCSRRFPFLVRLHSERLVKNVFFPFIKSISVQNGWPTNKTSTRAPNHSKDVWKSKRLQVATKILWRKFESNISKGRLNPTKNMITHLLGRNEARRKTWAIKWEEIQNQCQRFDRPGSSARHCNLLFLATSAPLARGSTTNGPSLQPPAAVETI